MYHFEMVVFVQFVRIRTIHSLFCGGKSLFGMIAFHFINNLKCFFIRMVRFRAVRLKCSSWGRRS